MRAATHDAAAAPGHARRHVRSRPLRPPRRGRGGARRRWRSTRCCSCRRTIRRTGRPIRCASPFHRFALVALAIAGHAGLSGVRHRAATRRAVLHRRHAAGAARATAGGRRSFSSSSAPTRSQKLRPGARFPAVLDAAHFAVIARPGASRHERWRARPELAGARRARSVHHAPATAAETRIFAVEATHARRVVDADPAAASRRTRAIDDLVPAAVDAAYHGA